MDVFIYSDESGVFDKVHNQYFVFGGVIFLSKESRDIASRKYSAAEKAIRFSRKIPDADEVKATTINNSDKNSLYRSLNQYYKFGVVVNQAKVLDRIYQSKKDKQRYLDYVYKIGVKRMLQDLIEKSIIQANDVEHLTFFVDEHTTATNGCYELREGLEQEFKFGTYNFNYQIHYPPIFPNIKDVQLQFCNSSSKLLVRAADIVANKVFYLTTRNMSPDKQPNNLFVSFLP